MKTGTASFLHALLLLVLSAGSALAALSDPPTIQLEPVLSGLDQPVFVGHAGDGTNRLFILEQTGRIRVLQPGASQTTVFLNIVSRVTCCGEQGLLGLAFHPQYETNGRFFVNYTRAGDGATIVAEYAVSLGDPNVANPTERVILTIPQPFANHNGGMLAFGPDGFLYIGMGDGGSGNDPGNRAQNLEDLLGKMLRIDVDQIPYASPPTNPFFGPTPGRDEIYAVGLRNPWRFSFDRLTGQLYAGDVGQNAREEIDLITLGGNFGWRVFEGTLCTNIDSALCAATGFTPPIAEYAHSQSPPRCSVTGGYAYRGKAANVPQGGYFYGDFCSGEIFFFHDGAAQIVLDTSLNISSFGEDEVGEHYVVGLGGTVSRITTAAAPPTLTSVTPVGGLPGSTINVTLSGTGFISGLSLNAGNGVIAGNIQVSGPTLATATLTIAADAVLGSRSLTVTTTGGTSAPVSFAVIPPPPTLEATTIASAVPGDSVDVTLTGTNLVDPTIGVEGGDVAVSNITATSPTSITATFTVSPSAPLGPRNVTVTTAGGVGTTSFLVGNPVPTLSSISPEAGARGTAFSVTLQGSGFVVGATTIEAIPGIVVRDVGVSSFTRMTATLEVADNATLGSRTVRVTTPGGTSEAIDFLVANLFPDLEISSAPNGVFGAGFDESFTITVRNAGGVPTSGAITVTDTLPNGLVFVRASGEGWSCSGSGANVSCSRTSELQPNASTSLVLTVAVGSAAAPRVVHTVAVSADGDLNLANNSHSSDTQVALPPTPAVVLTPTPTVVAGQQSTLALTIASPFPHDLSGQLRLTFVPDNTGGINDPTILFETGGRTVGFVIPANTTEAKFMGGALNGPIRFQAGTVAGTIGLQGTLNAGRLETSFSEPLGSGALLIPRQPPVIQNLRTTLQGGFAALITSFSTGLEITDLMLEFNTTVPVTLSCGNVQGCSASGNRISLNVASLFNSWFASDATLGSLSVLRLPLLLSGTIQGTVAVTLRNSRGLSNSATFTLP